MATGLRIPISAFNSPHHFESLSRRVVDLPIDRAPNLECLSAPFTLFHLNFSRHHLVLGRIVYSLRSRDGGVPVVEVNMSATSTATAAVLLLTSFAVLWGRASSYSGTVPIFPDVQAAKKAAAAAEYQAQCKQRCGFYLCAEES